MQTIVLVMSRTSIAQGLSAMLKKEQNIEIYHENNYNRASAVISANHAHSALIEVTENGEYDVGFCLALCDNIRETMPDCKLLLMCPEQDKSAVRQAVSAKRTGRITNFVFYDASLRYLSSMLLSV